MSVKIWKGKGLQPWRMSLRGGNGETIVTSEGYVTKWNAKRAAKKAFPGLPISS